MESTINNHRESYKDAFEHKILLTPSFKFLKKATVQLRIIGFIIFSITSINILFLLLCLIEGKSTLEHWVYSIIALTFGNFILTIYFEYLRKRGEAVFEEISDDLHWYIGYKKENSKENSEKKPGLEIRVLLRSFAKITDLPLIPGRFGPAIYIGINIVLITFIGLLFLFPKIS